MERGGRKPPKKRKESEGSEGSEEDSEDFMKMMQGLLSQSMALGAASSEQQQQQLLQQQLAAQMLGLGAAGSATDTDKRQLDLLQALAGANAANPTATANSGAQNQVISFLMSTSFRFTRFLERF